MDGYTEKTVYVDEVTDDDGRVKGYISNGCDDMQGGEICTQCRRDIAAKFEKDFRG